ncbi:beta-ketoacyl synthase N-terminal-like domain-containing protein [Streptomyces lacrimifluminis]|uniref:beta-ketoacyl synthase N-terminal-like domain-containing protein n=1 Tax=Streptomyces lacrimifluminis TaxID=1500077 RepID=UPI00166C92E8|nr:beta-ketoacyl synthase N-terminal-like domain-containing protein [Streptomyces lacrimifluminis]
MSTRCPGPAELAVTGVGVVSPWGDDPETAVVGGSAPFPAGEWFNHRTRLGPRGYKYLPSAAQYILAAARAAQVDRGCPEAHPADRRGFLLATNAGLAGLFDSMDATIAAEGAAGISPASAPYFAVNVLGNRLAAELSLNGFALTFATARTAAVDALSTGALALASGRCDTLVLAAVEEPVPDGRGGGGEQGAVALTLEPAVAARARGTAVRATLRTRSLFVPPAALDGAQGRAHADRVLAAALTQVLPSANPPSTVHVDLDSSPVSAAVVAALAGIPVRLPEPPRDGPYPDGPPEDDDPARTGRLLPPRRIGCLGPALAVARAVNAAKGGDQLVVCATGAGHVALVRVSPYRLTTTQESEHAEAA